jgi:hypothetical protein
MRRPGGDGCISKPNYFCINRSAERPEQGSYHEQQPCSKRPITPGLHAHDVT